MKMEETFPDYKQYLVQRVASTAPPSKLKKLNNLSLEALEEKNGELTYNRFERECDWNIFERDKPDLGVSVRKKWEAS